MVKRRLYKPFLEQCIQKKGNRSICIWGARRTGRAMIDILLDEVDIDERIIFVDRDYLGEKYREIAIEDPNKFIFNNKDYFIICAAETFNTAHKMENILRVKEYKSVEGGISENVGNFIFYVESIVKSSPKLIKEEREEFANMMATMYSHQNYISDLIVGGEYMNVAPITTKIGCPISCKYCPQDVLIKAYRKRPNPIMELSMDSFKRITSNIPKDVIISFTGFVEPFANPECLEMILYALDNGYVVRVFSTLYNVSIDEYKRFKDYENLKTLDIHLPDSNGNTRFPITDSYVETLKYVVNNPPKYARLWTSCLGVTSNTSEIIRDIISVNGNPVNSVHGLVYDNRLDHGKAKLRCNRDCSRIDNPKAGVGMILPNGDVIGCTQDWELENYIGNIFESGWHEIMQGELRNRFRRALENPKIDNICTYCELALETDQGDKIE